MVRAKSSICAILWLVLVGAGIAEGQTIDCSLKQSQSFEIESGKASAFKGASGEQISLSFTDLDPKNGTALLIGNAGSERISLIASRSKLTFIEVTGTGNVAVTSIDTPERGGMYGVHHRQMWLLSGIISTYVGPCRRR